MERIPASVGILTHNSAATLERALESVKDFDDIVICDGGSTDETLAIAHSYGARVITQDPAYQDPNGSLKDFSGVRNQCLDAARYDWFLYIDSDETISDGLHGDIRRITAKPLSEGDPLVYRIPYGIQMDGRYVRYSSNYPGYQTRFFNRRSGARFRKPIHERIAFNPQTPVGTLKHPWFVHAPRAEWEGYLAETAPHRAREAAGLANRSYAHYLFKSVPRALRVSASVFLKTLRDRLLHGSRDALPLRAEIGRALTPWLTLGDALRLRWQERLPRSAPRVFYIANNKIPTERAHGVQIMEMCSALAAAGAEVTLVLPRLSNKVEDAFIAYGIEKNFEITYLPIFALPLWLPGAFALRTLSFARAARRFLRTQPENAIVYTRGEMPLFFVAIPSRFALVWETHIKPEHLRRYQRAVERATLLVAVTKHYAKEIPTLWGISSDKVLYAPDGVRLAQFTHMPSKESAREELHLPLDTKIALYAGSDLPWKGLHLLRAASELLPKRSLTVFVGNIQETGAATSRRLFPGAQPYPRIPLWLAAADVLVLTGDPASETARYYTSPLKLFEYMASERPIVATDLPSTRDILSDESAYLAKPDAASLARAIEAAFKDPKEAAVRATRSRALVEHYAWSARARAILAHIPQP